MPIQDTQHKYEEVGDIGDGAGFPPESPAVTIKVRKEADSEKRDGISIHFQFTSVDICILSSRNICHRASLNSVTALLFLITHTYLWTPRL